MGTLPNRPRENPWKLKTPPEGTRVCASVG